MALIELTIHNSDQTVWINPAYVLIVEPYEEFNTVWLLEGYKYRTTLKMDDLRRMLVQGGML